MVSLLCRILDVESRNGEGTAAYACCWLEKRPRKCALINYRYGGEGVMVMHHKRAWHKSAVQRAHQEVNTDKRDTC